MKRHSDSLRFETIDSLLYANLGSGDVARAAAEVMKAEFAGHHVTNTKNEVLYYNGAANQEVYRDMYDKVMK